jgi:GT2 family glycosyltransferase
MNKGIEIALGRRVVNSLNRSERSEDKNCGIRKATGEYVQILNSGDLLAAPDVTERMMNALHQTSNIQHSTLENGFFPAIFYGNMLKSYDGKTIISRDTCGGKMYTPESFLYFYKGTLNHDCAYIRRDLFEKYGLYNEDMKICSDWEWYVRAIVLGGEKPIYTNIDVTIFDMNGVSESHGKNAELIKKERREFLESILPPAVLHDYNQFAFPLLQYQRLKKYHLWGIVHFIERVLFKLEKWGFVR